MCWRRSTIIWIEDQNTKLDTLPKCSYKDNECLKSLYQKAIHDVANSGVPELDVPPVDPFKVTNVAITIVDDLTINVLDGTVKGIRNCVLTTFHIDLEKGSGSQGATCDLTFEGQFEISGSTTALQDLIGSSSISGNGKVQVKLDKVSLSLDFPIHVIKKEDGNTYLETVYKNIKYKYEVGNASFAAENVFIGKDDISAFVVNYLNENWKTLLKSFGQVFFDKAMGYYFNFDEKIFNSIPTKQYITEDLSSFVKN